MANTEKPKATKIVDVTHPSKVAASSGARPVIITNRPVMASDPMMVAASAADSSPDPTKPSVAAPEQLQHQERILVPPVIDEAKSDTDAKEESEPASVSDDTVATESSEEPREPELSVAVETEAAPETREDETSIDSQADEDKQVRKVEQENKEDEARRAILEDIIEKGTFAVPINARKRQRSRKLAVWIALVVVLVLVVGGAFVLRFVYTNMWNKIF